jgi:thioredoxin
LISNDQSLDRVLAAGLPVALAFLDGPAGPSMQETLKRLAREEAGNLLVVQIPLRDNPAAARRFGVKRAPTVVTFSGGKVISQAENISERELEQHVKYLLGKRPKPEAPQAPETSGTGRTSAGYSHENALDRPLPVTEATFDQEVFRSRQPVLVDFWAPWCGPCRMTDPILEKLAREHSGKLKVAKVNVDEHPGIGMRYGVQGIPTMLVVKDGKIIDRWVGALPEGALRSRIAPYIR